MGGIFPLCPHVLQRRPVGLPWGRRRALVIRSTETNAAATTKATLVLVAGCWHAGVLVATSRRACKVTAAGTSTKAAGRRWRAAILLPTAPLPLLLLWRRYTDLAAALLVLLLAGRLPLLILRLLLVLLLGTAVRSTSALLLLAGRWCRLQLLLQVPQPLDLLLQGRQAGPLRICHLHGGISHLACDVIQVLLPVGAGCIRHTVAAHRPCSSGGGGTARSRAARPPPAARLLLLGGRCQPLRGLLRGRHPAAAGWCAAAAAAALLHHPVDLIQVQPSIEIILIILVHLATAGPSPRRARLPRALWPVRRQLRRLACSRCCWRRALLRGRLWSCWPATDRIQWTETV